MSPTDSIITSTIFNPQNDNNVEYAPIGISDTDFWNWALWVQMLVFAVPLIFLVIMVLVLSCFQCKKKDTSLDSKFL